MRIPLLRPLMPELETTRALYRQSVELNHFANFGPCFNDVVNLLALKGHGMPVATGTAALFLAARVHFRKFSRVVVPDFTCAATILAMIHAGHSVIIAPSDPKTWALDLKVLAKTDVTFDAMCVVAPFGYNIPFDEYRQFAKAHGKQLIFDLAGGWGLTVGNSDEPICYSFHATKNFAIGEGGLVVFQNSKEWEAARRLSNFGFDETRGSADFMGTNCKLDEWRCAMVLAHLANPEPIAKVIGQKRSLVFLYANALASGLHAPDGAQTGAPSVCVLAGFPDPLALEQLAAESGIGLRPYYHPLLSEQSANVNGGLKVLKECAEVAPYFKTCLGLPSLVTKEEFREVVEFIRPLL